MRFVICTLILLYSISAHAQQFRFDNIQFKTVFAEDLCKALQEHPNYTLLDVRSDGEYADTSANGLNIGRFKNALHISVGELGKRWRELEAYKNKPLFIYCSHSQRSRRASRLLSDSGFTQIFNINGGMSYLVDKQHELPGCVIDAYETSVPYTILTPARVVAQSSKSIPWTIVDLRSDSTFRGISNREKLNAWGRLGGAINIPFAQLESNINRIPINKPVLLVDDFGGQSPKAANILLKRGYKNVAILFNGMDGWMHHMVEKNRFSGSMEWKTAKGYRVLSAPEFDQLARELAPVIIDVRSREQFNNQSKNAWENIGHIKNAVSSPAAEMEKTNAGLPANKQQPIVLYTFNDQDEVYEVARALVAHGYTRVYTLYGGIWNLRWASHNLKDMSQLADWVVDVPADNQ